MYVCYIAKDEGIANPCTNSILNCDSCERPQKFKGNEEQLLEYWAWKNKPSQTKNISNDNLHIKYLGGCFYKGLKMVEKGPIFDPDPYWIDFCPECGILHRWMVIHENETIKNVPVGFYIDSCGQSYCIVCYSAMYPGYLPIPHYETELVPYPGWSGWVNVDKDTYEKIVAMSEVKDTPVVVELDKHGKARVTKFNISVIDEKTIYRLDLEGDE